MYVKKKEKKNYYYYYTTALFIYLEHFVLFFYVSTSIFS